MMELVRGKICARVPIACTIEDFRQDPARNQARSCRSKSQSSDNLRSLSLSLSLSQFLSVVDSSELIAVALLLAFTFGGLDADLLVVLLESSKILAGLRELALLHTLTDVPVDEGALRVHQIELVVDAGEDLSDSRGVADHADSAHNLREVATRHDSWWLVVDAALEASWAPIDELNGTLGL